MITAILVILIILSLAALVFLPMLYFEIERGNNLRLEYLRMLRDLQKEKERETKQPRQYRDFYSDMP